MLSIESRIHRIRKMRGLNNKSQVAIFVVLGIVIILGITGYIVATSRDDQRVDIKNTESIILDSNTIIRNVESCLLKTKDTIKQITENGGELVISEAYFYNGVNYSFWCKHDSSKGCRNKVMSLRKLEQELNKELKPVIDDCLNLSLYEKQGFKVDTGISTVTTAVGPRDLTIYLNKPISISKLNFSFDHSEFTYKFNTHVGRMFEIGNMILNREIKGGHFDKDDWMVKYGAEVRIDKHKPYPNTLYSIRRYDNETNEWLKLNFAIEGEDTQVDNSYEPDYNPFGWCKEGDLCFFNPGSGFCDGTETGYRDSTCKNVSQDSVPLCQGAECDDCGSYSHGKEWCVYDGPVGSGLDYVGSRHYKQSCVDGYIYTEECRDFREEICVSSGSEATCRPNRWKTCMKQDDQSSCEDSSKRDCMWFDTSHVFDKSLYNGDEQIKCVPQVPPGFRFWAGSGYEVCQMNNEWMDCQNYVSCPQVWNEVSMLQCGRLGDCGLGYSVGGELGNYSFMTTDIYDFPNGPSRSLLLGPEYIGTTTSFKLELAPLEYKAEDYNSNVFDCTDCTIEDLLTRFEEYSIYLESLDYDDLIWEYVTTGSVDYYTRHLTLCMPFQIFESGDCTLCNDPIFPCTEYKCRSIGNNCMYYIDDDGYGKCKAFGSADQNPEVISSTVRGDPYNSFSYDIFATPEISGLEMNYEVPSFSPFQISFNTTYPAQCKKGILPIPYDVFPFDLDSTMSVPEPGFRTSHEFTLYALPSEYIMEDLNKFIELQSFLELSDMDAYITEQLQNITNNLVATAEEFDEDPQQIIDYMEQISEVYNTSIKPTMEGTLNMLQNYTNAFLYALAINKAHTFFNCIDEYGNTNQQEFFISYNITEDNEEPVPLDIDLIADTGYPNINPQVQLKVMMNEPSRCRADFADLPYLDMSHEMDCGRTGFSFSIASAEGFPCGVNITKLETYCEENGADDYGRVYFRCRDKVYLENVSQSNVMNQSFSKRYSDDCDRY